MYSTKTNSLSNPTFRSSAIHSGLSLRGYSQSPSEEDINLHCVLLFTPVHTCPEHNIRLWGCLFMNFHSSPLHVFSWFQELSA